MKSVMSFPDRGHWGKSNWRGNASGYVIKEMIEHFQPKLFVDACEGSGTSGDVCREMGVEYVGLDLYKGNDFTKDNILTQLPRPADICFTHPPYHSMITYSGEVYDGIRNGDTSRCSSPEEFIAKSQTMLMKLGKASLKDIYAEVEKVAAHLIAKNQNWQAKIRQQLQLHFTNVERGVWAV